MQWQNTGMIGQKNWEGQKRAKQPQEEEKVFYACCGKAELLRSQKIQGGRKQGN